MAFAKNPVPREAQGPYRSGAVTLKVMGWVALITTLLMAVFLIGTGMVAAFFTTLFGAFMEAMWGRWIPFFGGAMGALAGVLIFFVMLMIALVVLVIGLAAVAWTSWIYLRWLEKDPRALSHALVFGIILTVLAGINILGSTGAALFDPVTLAMLVFGILLIVFSTKEEVKAQFHGPAVGGESTAQAQP